MVLNVSGNALDTLLELKCLVELTVLLAANNELDSLQVGPWVCTLPGSMGVLGGPA